MRWIWILGFFIIQGCSYSWQATDVVDNTLSTILGVIIVYLMIRWGVIGHHLNIVKQKIVILNNEISILKDIENYSTNFHGFEPNAYFKDEDFTIIDEYKSNRVYSRMVSKYENLQTNRSRFFRELKYVAIPIIIIVITLVVKSLIN